MEFRDVVKQVVWIGWSYPWPGLAPIRIPRKVGKRRDSNPFTMITARHYSPQIVSFQ
jgi:hypothetical protein